MLTFCQELVEKYREELVEKACEQDEEVLEAYLESGEAPDIATLKKCIRKGTLSFSFLARYFWNPLNEVLLGSTYLKSWIMPAKCKWRISTECLGLDSRYQAI